MTTRRHSRYGYRPRTRARVGRRLPGILLMVGGGVAMLLVLAAAWFGPVRIASRTIAVAEPPDVVWQVLTDLDNLPTWRRGVSRIERLPDDGGRPAWLEFIGEGSEAVRVAEAQRPLRLVTERTSSEGIATSWRWELTPTVKGSRLTVTRWVRLNTLGQRIMSGLVRRPGREVKRALAEVTQRLDSSARLRTTALNR